MSYKKRLRVFEKNDGICVFCLRELHVDIDRCHDPAYTQMDHIVPKSKGGSNDISNLQAVCRSCNSGKGNLDGHDISYLIVGKLDALKTVIESKEKFLREELKRNYIFDDEINDIIEANEQLYKANKEMLERLLFLADEELAKLYSSYNKRD